MRDSPPDWPFPGTPLSYTVTAAPRSRRQYAADSPTMPAPMTATGGVWVSPALSIEHSVPETEWRLRMGPPEAAPKVEQPAAVELPELAGKAVLTDEGGPPT